MSRPRQTRRRALACAILVLGGLAAPWPARSQQIVEDPANLAQNVLQVAQLVEQLATQAKQLEAMTSRAGAQEVANGPLEQAARRRAPAAWEASLAALEAGALPGDAAAMAGRLAKLRSAYEPLTAAELEAARVDAGLKAQAARAAAGALLAEAIAGESYDRVLGHLATVEILIAAIGEAGDVKAAQDLSARIAGEATLAQLELTRLQSSLAAQAALDANRREAARARMQRFLSRPQSPSGALTGSAMEGLALDPGPRPLGMD